MESINVVSEQRFQRLRDYLDEGWEIDPPIFVRPIWHTLYSAHDAYHFILRRSETLHLLVVPTSPEVDGFVREREFVLNRL